MHHSETDNVFSFITGVIIWGITSLSISLMNVNVSAWWPPLISVFSAFAAGFMSMWGKDAYKAWKQRRGERKK